MKDVSQAIARWLEQKRRTQRVSAAVISILALTSGTAVFLLTSALIYSVLFVVFAAVAHAAGWLGPLAFGLTAVTYVRWMKASRDERQLGLDPMGAWILKDIFSIGPRLLLEGWRQLRCYGELGELNVAACAGTLAYLAEQDTAVAWEDLILQSGQQAGTRLREQLLLLDGVLFLGDEGDRVTLMDPFRLRLRWMLAEDEKAGHARGPTRPRPRPTPLPVPVNEPERLSAYEILGLTASASRVDIRAAYRKRIKECHPDLFAGMDHQAQVLAERWTKALNAAYAKLKKSDGS